MDGYRLFLDSADEDVWRRLLPTGLFHGVTTNPLLLQRAGVACSTAALRGLAACAAEAGAQEIHLQAWGGAAAELADRGAELARAAAPVVVKLPATAAGIAAASKLQMAGISITLTAVFTPAQALAASLLGAEYAAPYFGRIADSGEDAVATVLAMHRVLATGGGRTRLLVASVRSPEDLGPLAAAGLDTFTIGEAVADSLLVDPRTETAVAAFEQAAAVGA